MRLRDAFALLTLSLAAWVAADLRADSVVVFNEIQYHPREREPELEWLELHNLMAVDVDISGWYLSDGVSYEFPAGTVVPGGGYLVVAISPAALVAETGVAGALGPFVGRLSNAGERLELRDLNGRVMDRVRYGVGGDWPVAPDGSGVSLAKLHPARGSERAANWRASARVGGTPGCENFPPPEAPQGGGEEGLVSYWNLDEASGQALDPSGGNHGNLGAAARRVGGLVGPGAVSFDNTSEALVNVGSGVDNNFSTTAGISVEALIVLEWSGAPGDADQVFRKEDGSRRVLFGFQHDGDASTRDVAISPLEQPVLSFGINVGGVYSELDVPLDGAGGRPALAALRDGRPHHLAATYESASGRKAVYVDGMRVMSASLAPGSLIASGGIATAYIGNLSGRREPFTGVIDEVAFWERALSDEEVARHWALARSGSSYFADGGTSDVSGLALAFNETELPAAGEARVEIYNGGPSVSLGGFVIASQGSSAAERVLPAVTLDRGAFHVLAESDLGFPLVDDDRLFLYSPDRGAVFDAVRLREGRRARYPDGASGVWAVPDRATFGTANSFRFPDAVVINEVFYHPREVPVVPEPPPAGDVVLTIDAVWRYDASGAEPPAGWQQPAFDDSAWSSGAALFYNESAELPAPKNTEIPLGPLAYFFRTELEFDGDPSLVEILLRPVIDDGAVFYLNGSEIFRLGMPQGPVDSTTAAAAAVGDARFTGPFVVSAARLRRGTNLLAASAHQRTATSTDVVFGVEVSVREAPGEVEEPPAEPPATWIELYNKSAAAVDLTGWRLTDGVRYEFAPGESIAAGEHLVVAEDPVFLRALHPGVRIVGGFAGRLSRRSDRIVLEDAIGNVADAVEYHDDRPWPAFADGGGSSLELRDPDSDNARPEAWAASDEGARTSWRTYTYTEVATANIGPTQWRDFCIGFLDAAEALIDDLSVIESPGGAERQFLVNGDFASGATGWRLLGNHRHSAVIDDPQEPGNRVLHLVATGPTEHMHNHVETTLGTGLSVVNGREYRVSFRARWLAGSNQLNTRLYFNRCPQTTLLEVPAPPGTPGARNSTWEANIGPTFRGLAHEPVVPAAGEAVVVSVEIDDPDGVASASLRYSVEGAAWQSVALEPGTDGRYRGAIPGQSAARTVQFYVEAADGLGATAAYPAGGRESRALFRTNDGQARLGTLHNVRILTTTADATWLHTPINVMSNDLIGTTIVYDEREVFYDAGVHLRASERGRNESNRVSFTLRFPADQLFRGVHRTVGIDRSGGWSGLVGIPSQDEIVCKHVALAAGGIPSMYDDICRVIAPRSEHTSTALLLMAAYGDVYLDSQYADGGEGTVFKYELIYYPTTADANGYKLPQPDNVLGTDIQNLGDDKELYRWNFLIENNRGRDDYSGLIAMAKAWSSGSAQLDAATRATMDVDEWMRAFALYGLCGVGDTYTFGNDHNNMHYVRPEDGKVLVFPWDMDFAWVRPTNASLTGDRNLQRIIALPGNLRRFYAHVRDIIDTSFNSAYIGRWTQHYGTLSDRNFAPILNYIAARRTFVLSILPPPVTFQITTNGGAALTVDTPTVTLDGDAGTDVQSIIVDGMAEPPEVAWTAISRWRLTVPLLAGANDIALIGLDVDGDISATDTIRVTTTFAFPAPVLSAVEPAEGAPGNVVSITGTDFYPGITALFGGVEAVVEYSPSRSPSRLAAVVPELPAGPVSVTARNSGSGPSNALSFTVLTSLPRFIRGDFNLDGAVDISDAVRILRHLFAGAPSTCLDAGDVDNDEALTVTDAIRLLDYLFRQGQAPEDPFPRAGQDADGEGPLACESGL
jgi:hypothetical protein